MRKLFDNTKPVVTLEVEAYTDNQTGTAVVDSKGFGDGMLIVNAGDIATTTGDTYTITLRESDSSTGTFTTTGISLTFTDVQDNTVKFARISELNLTRKRFLRADLSCSATTKGWEGGALILLGEPASGAVTDD